MNFPNFFPTQQTDKTLIAPPSLSERRNQQLLVNTRPNFEQKNSEKSNKQAQSQRASEISSIAGNTRRESDSWQTMFQSLHEHTASYRDLQAKYNALDRNYKILVAKYRQLEEDLEIEKQAKELYMHENEQILSHFTENGVDMADIEMSINTLKQAKDQYQNQKSLLLKQRALSKELISILEECLERLEDGISYRKMLTEGRYIKDEMDEDSEMVNKIRDFLQYISKEQQDSSRVKLPFEKYSQQDQIMEGEEEKAQVFQVDGCQINIQSLKLPQLKQNGTIHETERQYDQSQSIQMKDESREKSHERDPIIRQNLIEESLRSQNQLLINNKYISELLERISEQSKEGMSEGSGEHEIGQVLNRKRSRKKGGSEIKRMASEQFGNVELNDSKISEPMASEPFVGQHDEFHDNPNHTPVQLYQTLRAIEQKFTQLERSSARQLSQNKQERLVLTQQIGQLEEIIIRLREQILEMESEIKQNHWNQIRLEEDIKKKNMSLIEAHDKFKEQLRKIDQLKQEIQLEKDVTQEAQKELADKEMVIEEMTKQVQKLEEEVRKLRNSSVLISNEVTKQLKIREKSIEEKAKLIEEKKMIILAQSDEITRLKKENFDCSNRVKELTKSIEQAQSKSKQGIKKLEKQKQVQMSILKERLSISERSKEILSTEIVNLKKELIQKNTSFQKLSEQYTSSLAQLSQQNAPASLETPESIATEVSRISQLNQELKQTNHELAEKLIKMQNIKIKLEEQNCSLRKETEHQQMINGQVSEEVEKERHANEAFFQQNRRLQVELKSLSSDVEKERVSKKSLSIQIQSLQGSLKLLQGENKRMKERNQSLLAQIKKMASSNESSTESEHKIKGSLLSEIDALKSDVSELQSEISQMNKLKGELIAEMETLKDVNNSLEEEIQRSKIREENDFEQIQRLKLEKKFLAEDLKTARTSNAESAKANNLLKQSKSALLREIEQVQSRLNQALAQNYSIKIRNGEFAEKITIQEQSISKLNEQQLGFKTQNMQLKEQVAQLIALNGKLSNELQSLQENTVLSNHERETVVEKLETMRKEKDILEMEREEWRAECEKLKQMMGNMENVKQQICTKEDLKRDSSINVEDLMNGQRSVSNDSFQSIEMSQTPSKDKSMNEEFEFREIQTMSQNYAATSQTNRQYEEMIAEKDQIISKYEQNISTLRQQLIEAEGKLKESVLIKEKIQQELEKNTLNHKLLITELQKEKSRLLELQLKDKSSIKTQPFNSVGRQRQAEPDPSERLITEEQLQKLKSEHQTAVSSLMHFESKIDSLLRQNTSLRNQLSQQREEKDREIGTLQQIINQKIQEFGNKLVQQENNFQIQIENYQREIDSLQSTIAQYESQNAILTSEIQSLSRLIQNYENQKSSLSEQLSSVREQNSQIQIQTKIKEERGKMEKLTSIQTLTTEIDSLKRQYNQSSAKLKAVEFDLCKKTEQNAKLLQKISKYEDQLHHLSENLSSQINEKDAKMQQKISQLNETNAKLNQIDYKHKQELAETVSAYEEKLSIFSHKAKQQIEDREAVLTQIRNNYEEQFNLINQTYSKVQTQKEQEVQSLHQEIQRLRQNVQSLQLKLSDLELNEVNMTFSTPANRTIQGQVPYFSTLSMQQYPRQSHEVIPSNEFTSLKLAYQSLQRLHLASQNAHNSGIQDLKQSHLKELSRIRNEHEEKVTYLKTLNKKAKQRLIEQQKKLKSQEYNLQEFVQLLNEKDKVLQQIILKANQKDTAYQELMAETTSRDQLLRQLSQHLHEKQSNLTEATRSLKQKSKESDQLLQTKRRLDELQQYVNSFAKVEFELSQKNELLQKELNLSKENYEHQLEELFSRCQNYQRENEYLKQECQNLQQQIQKQAEFNEEKMRFIFHESKKQKLKIHTLTHSYKFAGQATKTPALPSSIKTPSYASSQTYLKQKKPEELQTKPMRLSTEVEYEKAPLVKSTQSVFIKSQQPIQNYARSHEIHSDMQKSINHFNHKPKSIPNPLHQLSEAESSFQPILMNAPNAQRQISMKFKVPSLKVDPLPSYSKNEFALMKSNEIPIVLKTESQVMRNTNNFNDRVVKDSHQQKQPFSYRPKPQRDSNVYSQSNDFFMIQNRKVPTEKQSDANPFNNVFESGNSKQQTSLNSFVHSSSKGQRPGTDFPKISEIPSPTHSLSSLPDFTSKMFSKNKSIAAESGKQVHQDSDTSPNVKIDSKKMFEMKMLEETIRRKREENEELQKMIKDKKTRHF